MTRPKHTRTSKGLDGIVNISGDVPAYAICMLGGEHDCIARDSKRYSFASNALVVDA
jgi:hypothetical protein